MLSFDESLPEIDVPSFAAFHNRIVLPDLKAYAAIHDRQALRITRNDADRGEGTPFRVYFYPERVSSHQEAYYMVLGAMPAASTNWLNNFVALYCVTQMVGQGVKVYRPTTGECEAMDHVDPRVPCGDYEQPFPTYVIDMPEDYRHKRVITAEDYRRVPVSCYPVACILTHLRQEKILLALVVTRNGSSWTRTVPLDEKSDLTAGIAFNKQTGTMTVNADEARVSDMILRAAVNSSLLLTQYGCKKIGPANEAHYARLLERSKKQNQHTERNRLELRAHPIVYGMEQHVRIYDEERVASGRGEGGGWSVGPHWRRGHWRREAGFARILHEGGTPRRVFVRPVLVNAHLLAGGLAGTRVNMTTQ